MYTSCISPSVGFRVSENCHCFDGGIQKCGVYATCCVSCSSCCCCRLCVHRVDLSSASLVYGVRQSSLLHWSGGRRLNFGGARNGVYSRLSGIDRVDFDFGLECCDADSRKVLSFECVRDERRRKRLEERGKGKSRIGGLDFVERREWRRYAGGLSEAEDLIDLLADNVVERTVVSIETELVQPRRNKEEKTENVCDECIKRKINSVSLGSSRGKSRQDELKKVGTTSTGLGCQRDEDIASHKNKVRKSSGSGSSQRNTRCEELKKADLFPVAGRRRSEGVYKASEKYEKLRSEGSGCTSYCSVSSSEEIESDDDIEIVEEHEHDAYVVGQSSKRNEYINHQDKESYGFFKETERRTNKQQGIRVDKTGASGLQEGNVVLRDRKKSEKQLVETAVDQSQSAAGFAGKRFSALEARNGSYNKSDSDISHKQFRTEDNSSLIANTRQEKIKSDNPGLTEVLRSRRRYKKEFKFEGINELDTRRNSNQLVSVRQEDASTITNMIRVSKEQREQEFVSGSSQQHTGAIQIQGIDDINDVNITNMHQDRHLTSFQESKEDQRLLISAVTEAELRRDSQQITNISEINRTEIQETSSSKKQSESSIKDGGSSLRSDTGHSQLEMSKIRQHDDRQDIQSLKGLRASLGSSIKSSGLTTTIGSKTTSHQGMNMPNAKVSEEDTYVRSQYKESFKKIEARRERQRLSQESRIHKDATEEGFKLNSETRVEKVDTEEEDKRTMQSLKIQAALQAPLGGTLAKTSTASYIYEMSSLVENEKRYHLQQQGEYDRSEIQSDGGTTKNDTTFVQPLSYLSSEDALGLADCSNLSNDLIEEFVKQADSNLRASEVQDGKLKNTKSENKDLQKQALVKYVSAELELKSSPPSSEGSEPKSPSDEKWDVAQSSAEPPDKVKTPEVSPKANNTSGKRTGRSLWNVIGDVVRARWIFREGRSSPSKSQKRSSSNESASSDAWFLGNEQDELLANVAEKRNPLDESASPSIKVKTEKEHTKSQRSSSKQYSMPGSSPTSGFSGSTSAAPGVLLTFETGEPLSSKPEMSNLATTSITGQIGTSPSFPSRQLSRSPVIGSTSLQARDDKMTSSSLDQIDPILPPLRLTEGSEPLSSGHAMSFLASYRSPGLLQSSPSLPSRRLGRSPAIGSTSCRAMDDQSASSSVELTDEQPSPLKLTEASEPEEQDREQMRSKFKRTTQFPRDKFEEWEEALKRETEQHKIDDIFMREALVEAQKAADNWEVPVGAVLVKDGKIVARGCNLVEELRDSTAHAEIICIRDASTALRTWRLSETTLYVTLEPCAMCAGAILQARVTTLVWGAPNKLLGADGSWIRLFPEDGERDNIPELADKPPAPVHPFHPKMNIRRGVLAAECAQAMQQFFNLRRQKKNKSGPSSPQPPSCLPAAPNPVKLITKVHGLFGSSLCL